MTSGDMVTLFPRKSFRIKYKKDDLEGETKLVLMIL